MSTVNNNSDNENKINSEIDLKLLINRIERNKKFIFNGGIIGLLLGGLIAINSKRLWQGHLLNQ